MSVNPQVEAWIRLIRAEFEELPDLHLTRWQVERLWVLDSPTAEQVLDALTSSGFLRSTRHGAYVRAASAGA